MLLSSPDPAAIRSAGFMLMGEPLCVDLANTVKTAVNPAIDLLADGGLEAFWTLESDALPDGAEAPDLARTTELREAVRSVLLSTLRGGLLKAAALRHLNEVAGRATMRIELVDKPPTAREHWSAPTGADQALAAVARSAIEFVTSDQTSRLRVCDAAHCSMLFVAAHAKRRWCTSDVCGNRARVARFAAKART
jgi:predicted RNA-binding Zn ribbon-like protein